MTISLYDAIIPTFLQILRGSKGWLGKAEAFAAEHGKTEAEMLDAALAPDMFPLKRQVRGFAMHGQGGVAGALMGRFSPDPTPAPESFAGLQARLDEAIGWLETLAPEAVDGLIGKPMVFQIGETRRDFLADQFLLSFTQPNFFFHATTAYAILRHMGVPLGKMDYIGGLRVMA